MKILLKLAAAAALVGAACVASTGSAQAVAPAPNCATFSGTATVGSSSGQSNGQLVAGDVVTMTATGAVGALLYSFAKGAYVISSGPGTFTYTVTAATAGAFLAGYGFNGPHIGSLSFSCSHPSGSNTTAGAQIEGQNSNQAINDMLDGVIGGSLGDTFTPLSAGPNGVAMMVALGQQGNVTPVADAPHAMTSESPWRMWMAGRYTHASGTETGDQFNGLFGVSRRFGDNKAFGLFGGYEGFNYTDATPSQLSGNGGTVGAFVAGKFNQRLDLDARVYTTFLGYNIATGGTTGSFSAQRFSGTLTASYELGQGPVSFKPFVRGTGLIENQAAYTDSAATAHAAQSLSEGILSSGVKLSRATAMSNGATFTPYISGEADYAFGNQVMAGFSASQGVTAKASIGASISNTKGQSFGIDASYGGIGSSINSESLMATVNIPF